LQYYKVFFGTYRDAVNDISLGPHSSLAGPEIHKLIILGFTLPR